MDILKDKELCYEENYAILEKSIEYTGISMLMYFDWFNWFK